jgi:hypothetical protein
LPDAQRISQYVLGYSRVDVDDQLELLGASLESHRAADFLNALPYGYSARVDLQLARLDFREVENVIDDAEQRLAAGADRIGILALSMLELRVQQQACHADHTIHWRANFMTHIGQEHALGESRGFGSIARFFELLVGEQQRVLGSTLRPCEGVYDTQHEGACHGVLQRVDQAEFGWRNHNRKRYADILQEQKAKLLSDRDCGIHAGDSHSPEQAGVHR